jgi:sporulation protein YlmC with PRC-barrel domain
VSYKQTKGKDMGKMKDVRFDIEDMLGEYLTYEQIANNLIDRYNLSLDFAYNCINAVIDQWDADERQFEIDFESKANA